MLSDVRCWEIFQTCYGISCAENASSLLSNTAGNTLAHIVLMIFSRPPRLTIDEGGEVMGEADSPASTSAIGTLAKPGPEEEHNNGVGGQSLVNAAPSSENTRTAPLGSPPSSPVLSQGVLSDGGFEQDKDRVDGPVVRDGSKRRGKRVAGRKPPATQDVLVMVMHFLSGMCNPRENSDEACVLALSLINIALEAGGTQLSENDSLVVEMQGDLCKHLLQSSQTDDLTVLSLTLRVVFNLFNSIKDHLKVSFRFCAHRVVTSLPLLTLRFRRSSLRSSSHQSTCAS
jgi:brefeldin A-resistance guanine nucleotide exchange factor 1